MGPPVLSPVTFQTGEPMLREALAKVTLPGVNTQPGWHLASCTCRSSSRLHPSPSQSQASVRQASTSTP